MRDRSGGRSAAKRAALEIGMSTGMVTDTEMVKCTVMVMRSLVVNTSQPHSLHAGGTQLQRERYAACRHKAGGNIGAKQKKGQQQHAGPGAWSTRIGDWPPHTLGYGGRSDYRAKLLECRNAQSDEQDQDHSLCNGKRRLLLRGRQCMEERDLHERLYDEHEAIEVQGGHCSDYVRAAPCSCELVGV